MKHETLMLQGLFAACLLVCTLVMGAMLTAHPAARQPTAHALATSASACATPTTNAPCPLPRG